MWVAWIYIVLLLDIWVIKVTHMLSMALLAVCPLCSQVQPLNVQQWIICIACFCAPVYSVSTIHGVSARTDHKIS